MKRIILSLTVIMVLGMMMSCNKYEDKTLVIKVLSSEYLTPLEGIKVTISKRKKKGILDHKVLEEDVFITNSIGEIYYSDKDYAREKVYYMAHANLGREDTSYDVDSKYITFESLDSIYTLYLREG